MFQNTDTLFPIRIFFALLSLASHWWKSSVVFFGGIPVSYWEPELGEVGEKEMGGGDGVGRGGADGWGREESAGPLLWKPNDSLSP